MVREKFTAIIKKRKIEVPLTQFLGGFGALGEVVGSSPGTIFLQRDP